MFDLKQKMDDIAQKFIKENQTKKLNEVIEKINTYDLIIVELHYLMDCCLKDKRVAVYGNGNLTKEFFFAVGVPKNIVCIIDNSNKETLYWKLEKVPVISLDELEQHNIDTVLIPSKVYEKEMKEILINEKFQGEILGLHSWIAERKFDIEDEFYHYKGARKYKVVSDLYKEYLKDGSYESFSGFIVGLLLIRDYSHAIIMIEKFLKEKKDCSLRNLKEEIEKVFEEVREIILKQNSKHVMFYVIDSLRASEIAHMPHLKQMAEDNFYLENLITQYGSTRESVMTMLTGYQIIENGLYHRIYFTKEDGDLLPYLKKEDYSFHFIFEKKDFAYAQIDDLGNICNTNIATEIYFEGLCQVLKSEKNTFNYMHSYCEMHTPFFNPVYEKELIEYNQECTYQQLIEQYRSSRKYIDELVGFYYNLLKNNNITQIVVGDHGISKKFSYQEMYVQNETTNIHRWDEKMIHPACIISNSSLGKGENNHLICNYSLAGIVKQILEESISKEKLEQKDDKQIKLEMLPIYNKRRINKLLNHGEIEWLKGFVSIWTKKDVYIKFEDGEERYYIHGKAENLIDDEIYKEAIHEYRKQLEDEDGIDKILELKRYQYHNEVMEKYKRQ